jgi:hypothetical protein
MQFQAPQLSVLPIVAEPGSAWEANNLDGLKDIESYFTGKDSDALLEMAQEQLSLNRSDLVHDLLALLAEKMTDLNEQRHSLLADFWLDLEGVTAPTPFRKLRDKGKQATGLATDPALAPFVDAASHSTRTLDEALAWDEAAFKAFVRALAGPVDGLSKLVNVYRHYAPRYRDLTDRIARTDRLIDQIVYQLYGLTDEEIAIVEGRGE